MPSLTAVAVAAAAAQGPCDIFGAAGTPCVAAHSTTRALYAAYAGPLYQVTRASDSANFSVPLLAPGGFADKAAHDAFCPALDCVISIIFDQSPQKNDLKQRHQLVNASEYPITVRGGVSVYGMCASSARARKEVPPLIVRHFRRQGLTRATATTKITRRALQWATSRRASTPS